MLAGFCVWALGWAAALAALSDLSLRRHPEHWCRAPGLGQLLRTGGVTSVGCRCIFFPASHPDENIRQAAALVADMHEPAQD